jgi:hypothetical protein
VFPDFEMGSAAVGLSTRMIVLEADPDGGLFYQFNRRKAQCLQLPRRLGLQRLGVLDMTRGVAVLDPADSRLLALVAFPSAGTRVLLLGEDWGRWLDENSVAHEAQDIPALVQPWRIPFSFNVSKSLVSCSFQINIYNREIYGRDALAYFREGPYRHSLELFFRYPTGAFDSAQVLIQNAQTGGFHALFELKAFPLNWPPLLKTVRPPAAAASKPAPVRAEAAAARSAPRAVETPPQAPPVAARPPTPPPAEKAARKPDRPLLTIDEFKKRTQALRSSRPGRTAPPAPPAAPGAAPARPPLARPLPRTESLPVLQLLDLLEKETDPERRWKMIEPNLMLGRPERTYPLITRFPELIAERAVLWPPARLKAAFGHQPGSMLIGLMQGWMVNQILALAEENAEPEQILGWLRERELKLDLSKDPVSVEAARQALQVDRHADQGAIKKTWRTLLGFMNADHGRSQERAIHRKKDEIAKFLQVARNLLLKAG